MDWRWRNRQGKRDKEQCRLQR